MIEYALAWIFKSLSQENYSYNKLFLENNILFIYYEFSHSLLSPTQPPTPTKSFRRAKSQIQRLRYEKC